VLIRPARSGEELAVARVHVRSWQAGYRGLFPDGFLDALRPEDRAERYALGGSGPRAPATLLAADGDQVAGFVTIGPSRDGDLPDAGEIYALYVDPDHWGGGVGRRLLGRARAELAGRGHPLASLWVLAGNRQAERFYVADGWRADGSVRKEDPWGIVAEVHRFRRPLP